MESIGHVTELRDRFTHDDFVVVRSLIRKTDAIRLCERAIRLAESGWMHIGDPQVSGTPAAYGYPVMERLLQALRRAIEMTTGLALWPTYSYFRIYKHADRLERHVDRPACEISVSLNLDQKPDEPWPLGVCGRQGEVYINLAPGDGLVYRGTQCAHWRDAYQGDRLVQVFLHYVVKGGPHEKWKFDKRPGLCDGRSGPPRSAASSVGAPQADLSIQPDTRS